MKEKPLVSVVMPAFNASSTIKNAIMSIVSQSYDNWELIIVDDGSYDRDALRDAVMIFNDERIRLIRIPHGDVVKARMTGYLEAQGELIFVQDADDLSLPDRLEVCVEEFQKDPEMDILCHSAYTHMFEAHTETILRTYRSVSHLPKEHILKEQHLPGFPVFKPHVIVKKPLREEYKHAYDWGFYCEWIFSGFNIGLLDRGLYEYVRHQNSLSERNERSGRRHESLKYIQKMMKEEYNQDFDPVDFHL